MFISENIPQKLAVIPDALIFITLGMNLALGLGYDWEKKHTYTTHIFHFRVSWFIGVIASVLLSAALFEHSSFNRYFVLASSFLVTISGILYIFRPYNQNKVLVARYINGIGVGLIIVPFIVHCSESIATNDRGYALGLEQLSITIGILIQITCTKLWTQFIRISAMCAHGLFCLVFGLIALGLSISFLHQNAGSAAVPTRVRTILSILKFSDDNELFGLNRSFILGGLGPLLRMILYRGILALIFSLPYNMYFNSVGRGMAYKYEKRIIIGSTILRILGIFIGMTMADYIGRKIISLIGLLVMGGLLVVVAKAFTAKVSCKALIILQFFVGLYAPTTTIYLSEAFPLLLKPFFIAFCVCFEYSMDIVLLFVFRYSYQAFGVFNRHTCKLLFASFVLFLFTMPETKLTTLTDAQERFSALMHLRSW